MVIEVECAEPNFNDQVVRFSTVFRFIIANSTAFGPQRVLITMVLIHRI